MPAGYGLTMLNPNNTFSDTQMNRTLEQETNVADLCVQGSDINPGSVTECHENLGKTTPTPPISVQLGSSCAWPREQISTANAERDQQTSSMWVWVENGVPKWHNDPRTVCHVCPCLFCLPMGTAHPYFFQDHHWEGSNRGARSNVQRLRLLYFARIVVIHDHWL